jgi:acetyl esterase/lipase
MLHIPELDDRLETPSMRTFVDSPLWNRPLAVLSWEAYLGAGTDRADVSPYAAPARATDLSGLPLAYISTAENDPLRDEGILYALGLLQAGVSVELHQFPGTFHGSSLVASAAITQRAQRESAIALRRALGVD